MAGARPERERLTALFSFFGEAVFAVGDFGAIDFTLEALGDLDGSDFEVFFAAGGAGAFALADRAGFAFALEAL